jgi:hypothetical protein
MLTARNWAALIMLWLLSSLVGCSRHARTYSIHTVTLNSSTGNVVTTTFGEVVDAAACAITTKAADKGIAEGTREGNASGREVACVSELPAELQKVASGERLPGAYIMKISWPPAPSVYSVNRGFPLNQPDAICALLTARVRDQLRDDGVTLTCQFPSDVPSIRAKESVPSQP